jgi:hypothetical protein
MYRWQHPAKVLAARAAMGCNRLPLSRYTQGMRTMSVECQSPRSFESRSVALFALLALAATLSGAQSGAPPASSAPQSTAGAAADAIPPNKWTVAQIADAFRKTDADGSGTISRQEAGMWTGLARSFDRLDSNRDGELSKAEFDEGLK